MQSQVSCKSIYRTCQAQRIAIITITIINKAMLWLTLQRTTKAWMCIQTGSCFRTIWTYYRTQVYYRKFQIDVYVKESIVFIFSLETTWFIHHYWCSYISSIFTSIYITQFIIRNLLFFSFLNSGYLLFLKHFNKSLNIISCKVKIITILNINSPLNGNMHIGQKIIN